MFKLLLTLSLCLVISACAATRGVSSMVGNHKYYDNIEDISRAYITKNGDVLFCIIGFMAQSTFQQEYSILIPLKDIKKAFQNYDSHIVVSRGNITPSCVAPNSPEAQTLTPLPIHPFSTQQNEIFYLNYAVYTGKHGRVQYYRTEDNRFTSGVMLTIIPEAVTEKGLPVFGIFYPIAFVVDIVTFPIQLIYCYNTTDFCGIRIH